MKDIILGIKDYCKDCWHDWLVRRVSAYGGQVMERCSYNRKNYRWEKACYWKEGSVWHYIRQRKFANNKI